MKASKSTLETLHELLATEFTKRIEGGEATAADLSAARQFLKDNNITAVAAPGSPMANLLGSLPFAGRNEEDEATIQ